MTNTLEGKKVLITGAAGFIGSHTVDAFLNSKAHVRALLHYNGHNDNGLLSPDVLQKVDPIYGDLLDETAVDKAVEGMDFVIHLGAIISIPFSYENPGLTTQVNVNGTLTVLQACLKHKIKRVIVTSTSEVYGTADTLPILETHPRKPQSPYSASKIGADALTRSFYCSYGLPVVTARLFNQFGPRQSDRAVIPTIICQALSTKDTIDIGTLDTKRDFVYVTDGANAFIKCAEAGDEVNGETFHFGTGKSYSVQEIIDIVQKQCGTNKPIVSKGFRMRPNQSEVKHLLADSSKAKKVLGWEYTVGIVEGIAQTIDYMRKNPDRYSPLKYQK